MNNTAHTSTEKQFWSIIDAAKDIFLKKNQDYGSAWRILRTSSLTDQIYIKAARIRSIQEKKGQTKIDEGQEAEFVGIINYCVMALIQLELNPSDDVAMSQESLVAYYDRMIQETYDLMMAKNHDYGEVWREMRVSSITDLILMKLLRVKSIENNDGKTLISEGLDANYMDMINYSVFASILLDEQSKEK